MTTDTNQSSSSNISRKRRLVRGTWAPGSAAGRAPGETATAGLPAPTLTTTRPVSEAPGSEKRIDSRDSRSLNIAIGVWIAGTIFALAAQRGLIPSAPLEPAVVLFACASILLVGSSKVIDRIAPLPDPFERGKEGDSAQIDRVVDLSTVRTRVGVAIVACGVLVDAVAVYSVASTNSSSVALPLWILAMTLCYCGVCLWTGVTPMLRGRQRDLWELAAVIAIMGIAFAFRFPDLVGVPVDVHGDEAAVGVEARRILSGEATNLFGLGWASLPELSFAVSSLTLRLFGNDLFGLRMASVIQGTLSVSLLYGVARRLFSVRVALISAIVLAVSQMAIHFSRSGNNYVQALFVSLLFMFFLLRGLSYHDPVDFLVAGYSAGLAANVYYPARLTLGLAALYCLHRLIGDRDFLRRHGQNLVVLVLGAITFFAPQAVWYANDPGSALSRTLNVFVLTTENMAHEYEAYRVSTVAEVLERQFVNSITAFNLHGETSQQYGQTAPLLDFWTAALLVPAVFVALTRRASARYFLLTIWLWLTILLGSILTVDAMFAPRMIAILAATAILPSLILETGWRGLEARLGDLGSRIGFLLTTAFLLAMTYANYRDYFVVHASTMEPSGFFTVLSRYVDPLNDRYRIYLLADNDTSLRYDTAQFLIPDVDGVDVRGWPLPMPLDRIPAHKGVIFIDRLDDDPRFQAILAQYPQGILERHRSNDDSLQFYSYRVEHIDLATANPIATIDNAPIPALDLIDLPRPG